MKQPQLYIKNDKGRYVPYVEPQQERDNKLYRKEGNRYVPCSMLMTDDLPEGVWVVTKHPGGRSITNGKYLYERYGCYKASDIQDVPLATLGGLERLAHTLSSHWSELPRDTSQYDLCRAIVGLLYKYQQPEKTGDVRENEEMVQVKNCF